MSMNDPLADMLTRIRNASMVNFSKVDMPYSKMKVQVASLLKNEGYIKDFHIIEEKGTQNTLQIELKYDKAGKRVITGLKRVSKPGRRIYARYTDIPKVMTGLGVAFVSTSKGMLTDIQAREQKIGGEIICNIW
nr:30S ribosomal protein S8 [Desulfobulbaceae bacterium]